MKKTKTDKMNTLKKHGLSKSDLVQSTDSESVIYQKYIKLSKLGLHPHTGEPLKDSEKWQFQYAAHVGTVSDLIGVVGGAYAGQKATDAGGNKNKGQGNSKEKTSGLEFGNVEKLETHFSKHGSELKQALNKKNYSIADYLSDANHVIKEGQFVPEMNGYIKLVGGEGSAKYAFVGLDRTTGNITTLHLKSVKELAKKAPSLGLKP